MSITEGDSGTKVATFTGARSDTLHFASGVDTSTSSVTVNGDTRVEANEIFGAMLSGITNDDASTGTPSRVTEDFNGNGRSDILWHSDAGKVAMWQMNGARIDANVSVGSIGTDWHA